MLHADFFNFFTSIHFTFAPMIENASELTKNNNVEIMTHGAPRGR